MAYEQESARLLWECAGHVRHFAVDLLTMKRNISLNGEDVILKNSVPYYAIDALYLDSITSEMHNLNLNELESELRTKVFLTILDQTEPPIPDQSEPLIPGQTEPRFWIKVSHF